MKYREVIQLLKRNGWYVSEIKGSHIQLKNNEIDGKVTVPFHSGDIPKGTLNSILKQSKLKGGKIT